MEFVEKFVSRRFFIILFFLVLSLFIINRLGASKNGYSIGDIGPAGGIVFYDKGDNSDGWRYMEAAPKAVGRAVWGCYRYSMGGTGGKTVGTGRENTINHVEHCSEKIFAAKMAHSYRGGGKDDWFLPSKDELEMIYTNLISKGLIENENHHYWSSTSYSIHYAWNIATYERNKGKQYYWGKYNAFYVMPVRYFSE